MEWMMIFDSPRATRIVELHYHDQSDPIFRVIYDISHLKVLEELGFWCVWFWRVGFMEEAEFSRTVSISFKVLHY